MVRSSGKFSSVYELRAASSRGESRKENESNRSLEAICHNRQLNVFKELDALPCRRCVSSAAKQKVRSSRPYCFLLRSLVSDSNGVTDPADWSPHRHQDRISPIDRRRYHRLLFSESSPRTEPPIHDFSKLNFFDRVSPVIITTACVSVIIIVIVCVCVVLAGLSWNNPDVCTVVVLLRKFPAAACPTMGHELPDCSCFSPTFSPAGLVWAREVRSGPWRKAAICRGMIEMQYAMVAREPVRQPVPHFLFEPVIVNAIGFDCVFCARHVPAVSVVSVDWAA